MALWEIKNVAVRGVTGTVPDHAVKTADFDIFTQEEADIFDNTVGIKNRYIGSEDICTSDLCFDAAERLLAALGWEKESVDVLVFGSVTGDYKTPPTAGILQHHLGLPTSTFVLDIPMGCCGSMYAINVAGNLLSAGTVKRALLLVGDTALRMGSMKDKSRVPLFGDSGTAMALEYDPEAEDIVIEFNTLGSGYEALITPHGGFRHPITAESFIEEDFGNGIVRAPKDTLINGMDVFSFAISRPPISIKKMMEKYELTTDQQADCGSYREETEAPVGENPIRFAGVRQLGRRFRAYADDLQSPRGVTIPSLDVVVLLVRPRTYLGHNDFEDSEDGGVGGGEDIN